MNRRHWIIAAVVLVAGMIGFQFGSYEVEQGLAKRQMRPLIGIASVDDEKYVLAVREAGGTPVILPKGGGTAAIQDYMERLDGLLMPGGPDIPPAIYGEDAHETVAPLSQERHEFENALRTAWIEKSDKPLLGICLGSQWINVLHGGTLVQDIPSELGGNHRGTDHAVSLEAGTDLWGAGIRGELEPSPGGRNAGEEPPHRGAESGRGGGSDRNHRCGPLPHRGPVASRADGAGR